MVRGSAAQRGSVSSNSQGNAGHVSSFPPERGIKKPSPLGRGGPQGRGGFLFGQRYEPKKPTPPLTRHPSKEGMVRGSAAQRGSVSSNSQGNAGHVSSFPPRRGIKKPSPLGRGGPQGRGGFLVLPHRAETHPAKEGMGEGSGRTMPPRAELFVTQAGVFIGRGGFRRPWGRQVRPAASLR